jgi:hypothetical protein
MDSVDAQMAQGGSMPRVGRPKGIQYRTLAPMAMRAVARDVKFYPSQSGTYSYTGQNTIQIPVVGSTGFLDAQNSYLHFKITNTCTNAAGSAIASIDGSAYSLFNRFRVIGSMGDEVERIDRFNKLASVLVDYNMTPQHRRTLGSAVAGFSADLGSVSTSQEGSRPGIVLGAGQTVEITLPLVSGLFGQDKYIPLGIIRGAGLRLEFLLDDPEFVLRQFLQIDTTVVPNRFRAPVSNGYTISDVYYTGRIVEFEGVNVNERLVADMQATGRPLIMRGVSFDYASTSGTGASGDDQHLFNLRARSVKAVMSFPDVSDQVYSVCAASYGTTISAQDHVIDAVAEVAAPTLADPLDGTAFTAAQIRRLYPSVTCRPSYNITQAQYTIGNLQMPPNFLTMDAGQGYTDANGNASNNLLYNAPQFQASAQECFNRFNDTAASSDVSRHNYAVTYGLLAPKASVLGPSEGLDTLSSDITNWRFLDSEVQSKFLIAINTDSFLHDQSVLDSGFDTASQGLSIVLRTRCDVTGGNGNIRLINNLANGATAALGVGQFAFQMLHFTMNEVFYEIDLNGQVIKAQ